MLSCDPEYYYVFLSTRIPVPLACFSIYNIEKQLRPHRMVVNLH